MEENGLVVGAQTEYDNSMGEGIDRMRRAGVDPHGDGCGEPATELVYSAQDFHNDCGDLCIGATLESTTELMQQCKDALLRLEWIKTMNCDLRFSHSLVYHSQMIGEYVINQLIENKITADMLEVE